MCLRRPAWCVTGLPSSTQSRRQSRRRRAGSRMLRDFVFVSASALLPPLRFTGGGRVQSNRGRNWSSSRITRHGLPAASTPRHFTREVAPAPIHRSQAEIKWVVHL
jgi:hypothetical protein